MVLRRILWAALILAAAILYLFDNETVTLAVLVLCIAAPLISGLLLALQPESAGLQLSRDGDTVFLRITNPGRMPLAGFQFIMRAVNQRTELTETRHLEVPLSSKKEVLLPLPISLQHAGRYEIAVEAQGGIDPLSLFRRKMAACKATSVSVILMVNLFPFCQCGIQLMESITTVHSLVLRSKRESERKCSPTVTFFRITKSFWI